MTDQSTTPNPTATPDTDEDNDNGNPAESSGDVVLMQEPGATMTSTGDSIVDNDLSDDEFEAALEDTLKDVSEGSIVEGVVVKIDPDEVLLDIGWKSEGVIPIRELSIKMDVDPNEVVMVGDVVEALVMNKEDDLGRLVMSKKRAQYERAWGTIESIYNSDDTVVGTVIEVVKGGLILDIGLRGFLPASLVEMRRVRDLNPYVGTQLECKIIELDKNRNNVVLSRRKFLEETQSEFRAEFLQSLQKGEIRRGTVSSIVNFGAFVDLGGVDGLVHVSELSWQHVDHPSEIVEVGDEVDIEVLDVDLERERVSLSLKATQEDPWQKFAREVGVGEIVEGEVTKLVPFGAFVKVDTGIEGLVHISELADRHVEVPEAVVNVGDVIDVKVIDIDTVRRRVSLSLKQVKSGADREDDDYDEDARGVEHAYSSGDDSPGESSSLAGALAAAGLVQNQGVSPEEIALAEAELPDQADAADAGASDADSGESAGAEADAADAGASDAEGEAADEDAAAPEDAAEADASVADAGASAELEAEAAAAEAAAQAGETGADADEADDEVSLAESTEADSDEDGAVNFDDDSPFGEGSAKAGEDGAGPEGWTIKGNADSMLFHTEDSPYHSRTKAEVWFESEEAAEAAGFSRWDAADPGGSDADSDESADAEDAADADASDDEE